MKAKIPRGWHSLPKSEKQVIADYLKEIWDKQAEKDMRIILDLYIKMVCLTLHDAFGFGEKRLTMFLGNHHQLQRFCFGQHCRTQKEIHARSIGNP